jgi:hypothetical protein
MNTITQSSGEVLTGKVWRKQHSSFDSLPFYSNITRIDEMAEPLKTTATKDWAPFSVLLQVRYLILFSCFHLQSLTHSLQKFSQGLDDVRPFSYTAAVDVLIREAETVFTNPSLVGVKSATRIWGFISKFVLLDRFAKTLGVATVCPGKSVTKKAFSRDDLGGAAHVSLPLFNFPPLSIHSQLLDDLNPPTKILQKFLKTWGDRDDSKSQYALTLQGTTSKKGPEDTADVALTISRRLMAITKVKEILSIEEALEMMALAVTISSEVCQLPLGSIFFI